MITMPEDIRIYGMQRLFTMRKTTMELEDEICPSIRKQLNLMKKKQRGSIVIQSGLEQFEVTTVAESYHVNLEIEFVLVVYGSSLVPCIHSVTVLCHINIEPNMYVSHWYSKEKWLACYSHVITPINGSKYRKKLMEFLHCHLKVRKCLEGQRKKRIRHPSENQDGKEAISRAERTMNCQNCWIVGHNTSTCKNEPTDHPSKSLGNRVVKGRNHKMLVVKRLEARVEVVIQVLKVQVEM